METDSNQIELNEHQRHLLASAADHMGLPWPQAFELAIAPFVGSSQKSSASNGKSESAYEKLSRLGLIGCIEGTPADLSTNKRHMEGYGTNA